MWLSQHALCPSTLTRPFAPLSFLFLLATKPAHAGGAAASRPSCALQNLLQRVRGAAAASLVGTVGTASARILTASPVCAGEKAKQCPDIAILQALKDTNMDAQAALEKLEEDLSRSAWTTEMTAKEKKKMKDSANKNGNLEQAGRGGDVGGQRGRGAGSGRGAGRGDSVPDRGGRAGVGGGRGGQTGGAPSRGGMAPRGGRGGMPGPAAAPPVSRAPPPPQAAQSAALI